MTPSDLDLAIDHAFFTDKFKTNETWREFAFDGVAWLLMWIGGAAIAAIIYDYDNRIGFLAVIADLSFPVGYFTKKVDYADKRRRALCTLVKVRVQDAAKATASGSAL